MMMMADYLICMHCNVINIIINLMKKIIDNCIQSANIAHYSHSLTCFNHFLACVKSAASEAERRDF